MSKIGIFDSGLGGLTGYRALRDLLPHEDLIYFGDNARVPYGTKSCEVIRRYAMQDVRFLLSRQVEAILIACGTVSSNALELLEDRFSLPFVGVVSPAAEAAARLASANNGKILVLGTAATVASGAYEKAIRKIDRSLQVQSVACPLFVPLAENGHTERGDIAATAIAGNYLHPVTDFGADVAILGCTHFPLLSGIIADILPQPTLISAGGEAARTMAELVHKRGLNGGSGSDAFYTSDDPTLFRDNAAGFLGGTLHAPVTQVDIELY